MWEKSRIVFGVICLILLICSCATEKLSPVPGWDTESGSQEDSLVLCFGTSMSAKMVEQMQEDYMRECGIRVDWINLEKSSLSEVFASGVEPDILGLAPANIEEWKDRLYDLSTQPWIDQTYNVSLEIATIEGKICAMPVTYEACGFLYNKDLFKQAGIEKLPQTVDELEEVCRLLDDNGIQAFGECYQMSGFAGHTLSVLFAYEENLDQFLKEMRAGKKTIADMKNYKQWLKIFNLMSFYGKGENSSYYSVDDQIADFAAGRMAMIKQGTWLDRIIREENADISMGLMAIPCTDDPDDCKLMVTTTHFLGVNKDSKQLDKAIAFLNWLQEHAGKYFGEMEGSVACFYDEKSQQNSLNGDVMRYIQEDRYFEHFGNENWPSGYNNDIMLIFQQYLSGTLTEGEMAERLTEAFLVRS